MSNARGWKTATLLSCASALFVSWACSSEEKPPLYFDPLGSGMGGSHSGGANAQGGSLGGSMMSVSGAGGVSGLAGMGAGAEVGAGAGAGGMGVNQGGFAGSFEDPEEGGAAGASQPEKCIASANCATYCQAASGTAACPRSYDKCVCQCEERLGASCSTELAAVNACAGPNPVAQCTPQELIVGCEQESFDLSICSAKSRGTQCISELPTCRNYCEAWLLTRCSVTFDSTMPACLCFCNAINGQEGPQCATEFSDYMTCTGNAPQLSCAEDGKVASSNCTAEWTALRTCTGAP